jgi:hypothetical protein
MVMKVQQDREDGDESPAATEAGHTVGQPLPGAAVPNELRIGIGRQGFVTGDALDDRAFEPVDIPELLLQQGLHIVAAEVGEVRMADEALARPAGHARCNLLGQLRPKDARALSGLTCSAP